MNSKRESYIGSNAMDNRRKTIDNPKDRLRLPSQGQDKQSDLQKHQTRKLTNKMTLDFQNDADSLPRLS